jgi:DNA polymerase III sliding clamp (beta) subunit (PCNA family)
MSATLPTNDEDYIFKIKTKEAYVIKILGELLNNTIQWAPLHVNEQGISLMQADDNFEQLIDLMLYKEHFPKYKCNKPLSFLVNSEYLYKMLKNIRKKNHVTLYVTRAEPNKLGISVESSEDNNQTITTIGITESRHEVFKRPQGYENPVIMSPKEFQNMKTLHTIGRTVRVTSKPGFIKFFCDGDQVCSRELVVGDESENRDAEPHIQHYNTNHLTGLTKCAGLAQQSNIQIYIQPALPMKIKMRAGSLGDLTIYIKSKEMLELEEEEVKEAEAIGDVRMND